jgi:ubiquinone/menaquinone biosynthesis C-methylase UbiE
MLNWFASGGADYARYRPEYPTVLLDYLLSITPVHHHALDVGCGTGQLTTLLACAFDKVTGIDPSQTQIDNAEPHPRVDYCVGPAEQLPHALHDINLITVAQAAHWFDLPVFYREAQRVAPMP